MIYILSKRIFSFYVCIDFNNDGKASQTLFIQILYSSTFTTM